MSGVGDATNGRWAGGIYLHFTRDGIFQSNDISDVTAIDATRRAAILLKAGEVTNYVYTPNTVEFGLPVTLIVP